MKVSILQLIIILCCSFIFTLSNAQKIHFNHTTVYVVDLQKSADFYHNVMLLDTIAEPFHDGKHVWFKIAPHAELHVVSGAKSTAAHDINIHLAFSVTELADFMTHLDSLHVNYANWNRDSKIPQLRPDEVQQIYFQDPDGYWIEVNDDNF
jgi:lactoylglutathione lyase